MIIRVSYAHDKDPSKICVFQGEQREACLINSALVDGGFIKYIPERYNVLVHPVTGLECALGIGDVIEFDTDTFQFTAIQGNENIARWERIVFDPYPRPLPSTKQIEHRIDLASGYRGIMQAYTLAAALESYVVIRLNTTGESEGEVVCTADIPFVNSDIERLNADVLFTYRGNKFQVARDGASFTIIHSGGLEEQPWAEVIIQIYTK